MMPSRKYLQVTLPSGETDVAFTKPYGYQKVQIFAPDTLPEVITIQVAEKESSGTLRTLQSDGVDVAIAAGKSIILYPLLADTINIHAGGAAGDDRVFDVFMGE